MVVRVIVAAALGAVCIGAAATANAEPYYRNCDAASDAGAAPVREGDPGYAPHLDRDSNGIGCE